LFALKINRNKEILREKLRARKEGEMKAILKLLPRMNCRIKKNIKDTMVAAKPYVTRRKKARWPKKRAWTSRLMFKSYIRRARRALKKIPVIREFKKTLRNFIQEKIITIRTKRQAGPHHPSSMDYSRVKPTHPTILARPKGKNG
jgi:hypothetical protein